MSRRYSLAVDFDGVLHRYDTPWIAPHIIPDAPVDGAIDWLHRMLQRFDIVIFTTRGRTWRGRRAVRRWLRANSWPPWWITDEFGRGLEEVQVTAVKPPALIYLDDRAIRFVGTFPTVDEVHRARPWHKEPKP